MATTPSFVQVTEGVGKKMAAATYTENSQVVYDQKFIPGEPYIPTYIAVFPTAITLNNVSGTQLVQLMAGASLRVYIRRITFYQVALGASAALQILSLIRVTSAPSGGTSITPSALDTADASSGATTAYLPSVAGTTGVRIGTEVLAVASAAPTAGIAPEVSWTFPSSGPKSLIIPAGTSNGLVITNGTGASNSSIIGEIVFQEASF